MGRRKLIEAPLNRYQRVGVADGRHRQGPATALQCPSVTLCRLHDFGWKQIEGSAYAQQALKRECRLSGFDLSPKRCGLAAEIRQHLAVTTAFDPTFTQDNRKEVRRRKRKLL